MLWFNSSYICNVYIRAATIIISIHVCHLLSVVSMYLIIRNIELHKSLYHPSTHQNTTACSACLLVRVLCTYILCDWQMSHLSTGYTGEAAAKSFYTFEPCLLSVTTVIVHVGVRTGDWKVFIFQFQYCTTKVNIHQSSSNWPWHSHHLQGVYSCVVVLYTSVSLLPSDRRWPTSRHANTTTD